MKLFVRMFFSFVLGSIVPMFCVTIAQASSAVPPCMAQGRPIPVNNAQVLQWEHSTPNQFLARAHVLGRIDQIFPDATGHDHFSIQIGNTPDARLEVIYNQEFGALPNLAVGMEVEACGDYITSNAQSGPYPPSPDGAIIHWVHLNPSGHGHDSGFLIIDGILYGYGNGSAQGGQSRMRGRAAPPLALN